MKISSDGKQVNVGRERERERERNKVVDSEDRYSTEKPSYVESTILYDCDVEALSISIHTSQSYSSMMKCRCCPELVQFYGVRSVEVLKFDTPPESPKICPESREGSTRVDFSPYQYQGRLCPIQDQSSPFQSSRPLGFGQVLSDQASAFCLEQCELACLNSTWNLG